MTTEQQIEGAKLIIEFMGQRGNWLLKIRESRYHTSWDWLMPVIDKFRAILKRFVFVQNLHATIIRGSNGIKSFDFMQEGTDVKAACAVVIEAIKWYTQNKSPELN